MLQKRVIEMNDEMSNSNELLKVLLKWVIEISYWKEWLKWVIEMSYWNE